MRLRSKFGDAEFDCEGDDATVREYYKLYLEAIASRSVAAPVAPAVTPEVASQATTASAQPASRDEAPAISNGSQAWPGSVDDLRHVFAEAADGGLSLVRLPTSENQPGDAALALLFGYLTLKQNPNVISGWIADGLRQSGVPVERIDRVIDTSLVFSGGKGRGTKYGLRNPGIVKAREIVKALLS